MLVEKISEEDDRKSYEEFKEGIFDMVESVEVEWDDHYPPAVFMATRENEGAVFYLEDIAESSEIPMAILLGEAIPNIIKQNSGDYFAIVAPTIEETEDGEFEKLILAISDRMLTEVYESKVQRGSAGYVFLDSWVERDPQDFDNMLVGIKRAINHQG